MPICHLCPNYCNLSYGEIGKCHIRIADNIRVRLLNYGIVSSLSISPIEKKLYHFCPSSRILSVGSFGCNMSCLYCQNSKISQSIGKGKFISASNLVKIALKTKLKGIAFTHSEPTTWYEYIYNTSKLAKSVGIKTILKTNGYIVSNKFEKLCYLMDAIDIDLKGSNEAYKNICGVNSKSVLENIKIASKLCHLEISYPVILEDYSDNILETLKLISGDVPLKLIKIVPGNIKLEDLKKIQKKAHAFFSYVYLHIPNENNDTFCKCGNILVSRKGLKSDIIYSSDGKCYNCNMEVPFIL